jgi:[ribosomal protein S5]-alanine N-acetyltransferase
MADEHTIGADVALETQRLRVRTARVEDAAAIARYHVENREHLRPFDPERPATFFTEAFWRMQIRQNAEEQAADRGLRLFLFPKEDPARAVGNISFSNFVRGVGQYCTLGYSVARNHEGKGLMREALEISIEHVFRELNLHRIEANYMPHNVRSGRLLRRLGFSVEGYSRDYLMIAGAWEDHVRTAWLSPYWSSGRPRR